MQRTPCVPTAYSLQLTVQTKTAHQVGPQIPDHPGPDQAPSPCETACPHDQTAGREFSCRQTGHQNPGTATTEPAFETAQVPETSQPTKPDQSLA